MYEVAQAIIILVLFCIGVMFLCLTWFVVQITVERFLINNLPILLEAYARIRYPNEFKD